MYHWVDNRTFEAFIETGLEVEAEPYFCRTDGSCKGHREVLVPIANPTNPLNTHHTLHEAGSIEDCPNCGE